MGAIYDTCRTYEPQPFWREKLAGQAAQIVCDPSHGGKQPFGRIVVA
jgi:hypothetical protein